MMIQTERLILKNYCEEDLESFYALKAEPLVWKYSSQFVVSCVDESRKALAKLIEQYNHNDYNFKALFSKQSFEYIGEAGILSYNKTCNRAVVGYNLLPKYWGNGYATEITKGLVKYLFEQLKVERVEALVIEENKASINVLTKSGFMIEGILRNFAYIDNEYCNVCYLGIIREDYENQI